MDTIVVDSSVAIKWFVVEPYSTEARSILDSYQTGDLDLLVPDLIYAEIGSIVWKKHRFQGLATLDAQQIIEIFGQLRLNVTSTATLLDEAYRLAVTHQCTVYDAMYIALSVREQSQFITADEKLANALKTAFPNVVWIAVWPSIVQK